MSVKKSEQGLNVYLVGGAVRDRLLNCPVSERDWVVVGATPKQMLQRGFKPVGKDFPVFLHPQSHEEYALARTERKIARGYTGFEVHADQQVTLEQDLQRRDLTINAMAMDERGQLIDPYGGEKDLHAKILRHVSPAFVEDPVRILRLARLYARFAQLGFIIAKETVVLMRAMVVRSEVAALIPERVWQELARALLEPSPEKFFESLRVCGALKIIFPEIDKLYGVPNPKKWHPEIDSGIHTMMVLQQAARLSHAAEVRFAALVHDLGKGSTPQSEWPSHPGHGEAGIKLVQGLCDRLRVPKNYRDLALMATRYHGNVHKVFEVRAATVVALFEDMDAFRRPGRFEKFLLVCEADAKGRPGYEDQDYPQKAFLLKALAVARDVKVQPLLDQGFTDGRLAEKLHQLRVLAVKCL